MTEEKDKKKANWLWPKIDSEASAIEAAKGGAVGGAIIILGLIIAILLLVFSGNMPNLGYENITEFYIGQSVQIAVAALLTWRVWQCKGRFASILLLIWVIAEVGLKVIAGQMNPGWYFMWFVAIMSLIGSVRGHWKLRALAPRDEQGLIATEGMGMLSGDVRMREKALEARQGKLWPLFLVIFIPAFVLDAAANYNWAFAAGQTAVPMLVGFLVIRWVKKPRALVAGYVAFAVLLYGFVGQSVFGAFERSKQEVHTGCMERNQAVAQLPTEDTKKAFCACLSEKLALPALKADMTIFLTFRDPAPVRENATLMSAINGAWNQCAALM